VIVVVPAAAATSRLPLVIALHGNGDTNTNFVSFNNLDDLATAKGYVLAAPQGISQTVMVGGQTVPNVSWDAYRAVANGNIDLPLIDAIRAELGASSSIDGKKIFTFGYSQGGYMSFRYAMETAASVSCGAVLAAANPLGPQLVTGAARKVPIAMQIGTNDFAINQARQTKTLLEQNAFPLDYHEIQGAGHVPIPGDLTVPLDYCLAQQL
jgi:polyhydroxybutyrate depolymerase